MLCLVILLIGMAAMATRHANREASSGNYTPPEGALVTFFPAIDKEQGVPLVVSASMDAGFMRPFFLAFQRTNRAVAIAYIHSRNGALLDRALAACQNGESAADIYLTSSTDHLVRLANEKCAATLPSSLAQLAPARAAWRDQVVAFTVEPAVFVFSRRSRNFGRSIPSSHIELLDWLRQLPLNRDGVGTYDIEASADGYDLAAADARQEALYGRLLESLGRADIKLYCCSNVMVDAVDRGEILFAYNVQLSYAYAAQRAGSRVTVVLPNDYQALQTVSFMLPTRSRDPATALKLAQFLVSDGARNIARKDLAPPGVDPRAGAAQADQLLYQASVSPTLLSLQDRARRSHIIREWREAIGPFRSAARYWRCSRSDKCSERSFAGSR